MSVTQQLNNGNSGDGVIVNEATILDAKSVSNVDYYKNGKPLEVGVELTMEIGQAFSQKVCVGGNIEVGKDGKINWSSVMAVKNLLNNLNVKWTGLNPDNSIPDTVLEQLKGLNVFCISYKSGKIQKDKEGNTTDKTAYSIFREMCLASEGDKGKQKLRATFDKALAGGSI